VDIIAELDILCPVLKYLAFSREKAVWKDLLTVFFDRDATGTLTGISF